MCGIFGFTGFPDDENLRRMGRALSHRGPDEAGQWHDAQVSLGIARLSLVDVASASQPFVAANGAVQVVFNGEIYNSADLRRQLEAKGHRFRTSHGDGEVIPHLYEAYGADGVLHLEGMFAFALWDARQQTLLLARDAVGIKPLFYTWNGKRLLFASEIKALLAHSEVAKQPDFESLHHYFSLKNVPSPRTAFRGIEQLEAGERLTFRRGEIEKRRWWRFNFSPELVSDEPAGAGELRRLLEASVASHVRSDVEVGAFLSGGLDSSTVVALMSRLSGRPVKTFSLVYDERMANKEADRISAREVAKRFGTELIELEISVASLPEEISRIVDAFDEPFSGSLSTYFLAKRASREVKAVLTGDGADELFGSYRAHRMAAAGQAEEEVTWRMKLYLRGEAEKQALYTPLMRDLVGLASTERLVRDKLAECAPTDALNRMLYLDFVTLLPDQVLAFSDRLAMAHSLEVRPPFLDPRLVEFASRIPGTMKIKHGRVKHLLKEAVSDLLPAELIDRPKEGFILPLQPWWGRGLSEYAAGVLSRSRSGLFRAPGEGIEPVWNLVMFELWWEKHFA